MRPGRRGRAAALRPASLPVLAVAVLAVAVLAGATLASGSPRGAARPAGTPALTSLILTSVGSGGAAANAPSTQAAVAASGRYVAFQSQAALRVNAAAPTGSIFSGNGSASVSRVYVHDLVAGGTTLLSDPAGGDATAPAISATGRLVGYEQDGNVYVADRQATGTGPFDTRRNLVVRQVTGTANDQGYEHVAPCPAGLDAGLARITPCGPRLSADGTTLVYPAELTPVSPQLSVTAAAGDDDASTLNGDMLDFTPYYGSGETYGFGYPDDDATATLTYTNTGGGAITFRSPPVTITEPPGSSSTEVTPFSLGQPQPDACASRLSQGRSCTVTVSFATDACSDDYQNQVRLVSGDLVTHATTPAGQSVLGMTGFCDYFYSEGALRPPAGTAHLTASTARTASTASTSCPEPPDGLAILPPAATADNQEAPLADAGEAEAGRPYLTWTPVVAPLDEGSVLVEFVSANGTDCQIQLVNPKGLKPADPLPPGAPGPCRQGETLSNPYPGQPTPATGPPAECTAYLLVNPGSVTPDSAFIGVESPSPYEPEVYLSGYLTMQGVRHVIVARRDAAGAGNFAASPSTVVSVTGSGTVLPGASEPSVSADGRYVSFAAPVPAGRGGQQLTPGASQAWLHDTDKAGDHSYRPGATTLVSCLPEPRAGPCQATANADSPSVSGDGQQVAFATTAAVVPDNGYPGVGTDAFQTAGGVSPDQIYLRSVANRTTTLISAPFGRKITRRSGAAASGGTPGSQPPAGGDGPSYAPVITQDASTVAYVSQATDLTGSPGPAGAADLYLRPASGGPVPSELAVADGPGTVAGPPSADAHGRLVTFPATAALVAGAPPGIASVYTFDRLPRLSAVPTAASFGPVLIDSGTRSLPVTVTDGGPGPATVTGVRVTGSFRVPADRCTGVTMHEGSRCTVTVTFTPTAAGPVTGTLNVTTQDDDEPPVIASVPASAAVPSPRLAVFPSVASAGDASQVQGTSFPPHQQITLTWDPGLGSATALTTASGGFSAAMVIFPNDFIGPRRLIASGPAGRLATAPFLVQYAPAEPPFTASPAPP